MREIKKGDKYLCKTSDYKKGYFTKGNIYEVHFVNGSNIVLLTDSDFAYCLLLSTLNKDFKDLQEVNEMKVNYEVVQRVKECSFCPDIDIENHHDLAVNELNKLISKTPSHYDNKQGYDVIDISKHYSLNFNRGNVVKYICRAGKKDNELQDLKKALDYLQREIQHIENN
jgi:hypothetical protein